MHHRHVNWRRCATVGRDADSFGCAESRTCGRARPKSLAYGSADGKPLPSYSTAHELNAVAANSPRDVWAVGQRDDSTLGQATLIDHYTGGSSFTDLGGPNVSGVANVLFSIAAVPGAPSNLWAVGYAGQNVLILHHA